MRAWPFHRPTKRCRAHCSCSHEAPPHVTGESSHQPSAPKAPTRPLCRLGAAGRPARCSQAFHVHPGRRHAPGRPPQRSGERGVPWPPLPSPAAHRPRSAASGGTEERHKARASPSRGAQPPGLPPPRAARTALALSPRPLAAASVAQRVGTATAVGLQYSALNHYAAGQQLPAQQALPTPLKRWLHVCRTPRSACHPSSGWQA